MRVTIQKTIDFEEMPEEMICNLIVMRDRILGLTQMIIEAQHQSEEGLYLDQAEVLEKMRSTLSLLDQSMEEQQSLCVSYERIRLAKLMPQGETSAE